MPLVLLKSEEKFTLPLRQAYMARATDNPSWVLILAATCLAVIPVVFIFLALQKQFVTGVMEGAVKG
ncbi:MAG: N-Acetyl-D-glucosamine ABC transport system permease protein 2 [Spirochaetes bacterium]|nr:MAG: N-Acetyl-D-glucosamine ABC transport system permease protein 2 [Spirochaetota bacterium]